VTLLWDITEQKRAEEQHRKTESQTLHSQKFEGLGVVAGGIAHDFNNLLMAILGNVDLALSDVPPDSPTSTNLAEAKQASQKAAELCKHMLACAGKSTYALRPLDLRAVIEEMRQMIAASFSKSITFTVESATELPAIDANPAQLHQVVMNLVVNAVEAIGDGTGVITVRTGVMDCTRAYLNDICLGEGLAEDSYVFLEIADTGCGIDAPTRQRIFDPFFSTKFVGRGLGLAAVMGIVRVHGGAIAVTSAPGAGTTFRILFPASRQAGGRSLTPDAEWRGTGALLLVEDDEMVLKTSKNMLEKMGFTVHTAWSNESALTLLRQHRDCIVAAVVDLTLPFRDGIRTSLELREIKPGLPVLLASDYPDDTIATYHGDKGLAGFIQKPYTRTALAAKLRTILGG
jgi:nitrogen-specific signal transduction histidine kinase/CheY-like chemotaxis protein